MDYVNLGPTGLKVSRLCLGAMTYGSKTWRPWVLDEEAAQSPQFKKILQAVEDAQLEGKISSRDEALRMVAEQFPLTQ